MADFNISHEHPDWNLEQLKEMLGEDNRNFFRNTNGREPKDNSELIFYYIENNGAIDFDKRNEKKF